MLRRMLLAVCGVSICAAIIHAAPATPPASPTTMPAEASVITGSAVILSDRTHRDDPGSSFSFARGIRGGHDSGYRSGDVSFGIDTLRVQKHTGDRGSIVDLGEHAWSDVAHLPQHTASDANKVKAIAGHVYLVHIDDLVSEYWALLRVTSVVPEDRCEVEWLRLDAGHRPEPAIKADDAARLATLLTQQDDNLDPAMFLQQPMVVLQVFAGAGGGNPNRIDMTGEKSIYVDRISATPLKFDRPPTMDDDAVAYFSGGRIANGKVFVVEHIDYAGSTKGDTNGRGEFILHVGKEKLISQRDKKEPIKGEWTGHIEIRPGQERTVFVEIANSSTADVKLTGHLMTEAEVAAAAATQPAGK